MPKVRVNSISLHYEIYGEDTGIPIIFVAGFSADHSIWGMITDAYVKNGYKVILFDNRGVGQSDCPDCPYNIEMMAQDVIGLCNALNIRKTNFIGNSMGGRIVQQLAYQYPEYVIAVVISNSYNQVNMRTILYSKLQLDLLRKGLNMSDACLASNLGFLYSDRFLRQPQAVENFVNLMVANPYPISEVGYRSQLNALIDDVDTLEFVGHINKPCLIFGGDEDIITPSFQTEQLAKAIPDAEYYCFTSSGHVPHIEHSELYNKIVLDFLRKHNQ